MSRGAHAGRIVAALAGTAIAALTLYPVPGAAAAAAATPLYCLVCGERGGTDVILNLLLFVPLGVGVRLGTGSTARAVMVSAALSLTVELLQLTVVAGRDASLSDLVTNTTGGWLGALIATRLRLLARPDPGQAGRLLLAGGTLFLALLGVSAWVQSPEVGSRALTSTWATPGAEPDAFLGRVLRVSADGRPMPVDGVPEHGEELREALREGRISLEAGVASGTPTWGRRWIYVIGERHNPSLFLSQQGRSAVLGVPARALQWRLNPPTLLLPDAFPPEAGAPRPRRAGARDRTLWLAAEREGYRHEVRLALSPAHGWVLVAPFGLGLGRHVRLITALLLGAGALVLAYWGAATHDGARAATTMAATLLAGLALLPALGGFRPVHWSEWMAAGSGAAGGWALHRAATYLQARCGSPSANVSSSS